MAPRSEHACILAEVYGILLRAAERAEHEEGRGTSPAEQERISDGHNIAEHSQQH